jgi:site-specific DNA recombinase
LRSIVTSDREHKPDDNALLLSVETGMANQFVLELSRNVRRGIQGKLARGGLPGRAPVGYLNHVSIEGGMRTKTVITDPERFETIRDLWKLLLTGNYSVPQLRAKLNKEWGFRTARRRKSGGSGLALSSLYRTFSNPFYAGLIRVSGKEFAGRHQSMITLGDFEAAQRILGKATRPRPSKHCQRRLKLHTFGGPELHTLA